MAEAHPVTPARRAAEPAAPAATEALVRHTLIVENMHCGGCMSKVERALTAIDGIASARANLTARRVTVAHTAGEVPVRTMIDALAEAGFRAADIAEAPPDGAMLRERALLRRIGIAGFAAANIMLLSTAVWAGAVSDMGPGLSSMFHWVSALIALPAVAHAGQPFYSSALDALKARRLNMDVPISVAILLATGMSLFQTLQGSEHVYFDAATALLFFLLIGRFLDQRMRVKAMAAAQNLMALKSDWASVIETDGSLTELPARLLVPGMHILVAAGARVPADGVVRQGLSDLDESLITGETAPHAKSPGGKVYAGTLNLTGALEIEATATEDGTLLAEIGRLMEAAEQGRGRYVRLADRASRIYGPLVHLLGLATFAGWLFSGYGWEAGLTAAIAVLIITCPCALALAVPVVQVAATSRLFGKGTIVKASDALERLAEVDTVVLDKTGTLTLGEPELVAPESYPVDVLRRAATLAAASRHPYSRALVRAAARSGPVVVAPEVTEHPGLGLSRKTAKGEDRLGSAAFTGVANAVGPTEDAPNLWFTRPGALPVGFSFLDRLRPDAIEVVKALQAAGYRVELLSGDSAGRVAAIAAEVGIDTAMAEQSPADKLQHLADLTSGGRKVLMVGDGLNDAPALAAGHASLSPATAADISQTAADVVWQGVALMPLVELLAVARESRRMALQNFGIALVYNVVSVPLAMLGHVTPLIAAIAMSTSSLAVTVNALRLRGKPCHLGGRQ